MDQISTDELLKFAKSVEGKTLRRNKEFTVVVTEDSLVYIPVATNTRTKNDRHCVDEICKEFSKTNNDSPSHYVKTLKAWHASYSLTLIHMCLGKAKTD